MECFDIGNGPIEGEVVHVGGLEAQVLCDSHDRTFSVSPELVTVSRDGAPTLHVSQEEASCVTVKSAVVEEPIGVCTDKQEDVQKDVIDVLSSDKNNLPPLSANDSIAVTPFVHEEQTPVFDAFKNKDRSLDVPPVTSKIMKEMNGSMAHHQFIGAELPGIITEKLNVDDETGLDEDKDEMMEEEDQSKGSDSEEEEEEKPQKRVPIFHFGHINNEFVILAQPIYAVAAGGDDDNIDFGTTEVHLEKFRDFVHNIRDLQPDAQIEGWRMEMFHRKGTQRTLDAYFVLDSSDENNKRIIYRSKDHYTRDVLREIAQAHERERYHERKKRMKEDGAAAASDSSPDGGDRIRKRTSKRLARVKKTQEYAKIVKPKTRSRTGTLPSQIKEKIALVQEKEQAKRKPTDIQVFAQMLKTSKSILVVLGAGVSTSAGLPDFRTKSTGLYSTIANGHLGKDALPAELIFHSDIFDQDPVPFYDFAAKTFLPLVEEAKPTLTHQFVNMLASPPHEKLLRCYTQNVDGLEKLSGLEDKYLIMCHGTMRSARCMKCNKKVTHPYWWKAKSIANNGVPECEQEGCRGDLKPEMTFFGEQVSGKVDIFVQRDVKKCDLLIVIGTSLSVQPVSEILASVPEEVPKVWINRASPSTEFEDEFEIKLNGECDEQILKAMRILRWAK